MITDMELVQIPKEFRPNKHEHKSPWAYIIVLIAILLCGGFFLSQKNVLIQKVSTAPAPSPQEQPKKQNVMLVDVEMLEASIGSITIPDYTSVL